MISPVSLSEGFLVLVCRIECCPLVLVARMISVTFQWANRGSFFCFWAVDGWWFWGCLLEGSNGDTVKLLYCCLIDNLGVKLVC